MSILPKLKVTWWSLESPGRETICDFEQAKDTIFGSSSNRTWSVALAEGQAINSYQELVQLASQEEHKDKELFSIALIVSVIGGG
ncbi:MAG: hypothetical protein R6V59_08620 [Dehalococcoidia bacterium]